MTHLQTEVDRTSTHQRCSEDSDDRSETRTDEGMGANPNNDDSEMELFRDGVLDDGLGFTNGTLVMLNSVPRCEMMNNVEEESVVDVVVVATAMENENESRDSASGRDNGKEDQNSRDRTTTEDAVSCKTDACGVCPAVVDIKDMTMISCHTLSSTMDVPKNDALTRSGSNCSCGETTSRMTRIDMGQENDDACDCNRILWRSEPSVVASHDNGGIEADMNLERRDDMSHPPDYCRLYPLSRDCRDVEGGRNTLATISRQDSDLARTCYDNLGFHDVLCSSHCCRPVAAVGPRRGSFDLGAINVTIEGHSGSLGGLPTYKSLTEFLILDAPPNYEIVTGKKVEHDQVFAAELGKVQPRSQTAPLTFGRKIVLIVILVVIAVVTVALIAAQQLVA